MQVITVLLAWGDTIVDKMVDRDAAGPQNCT